MFWLLVFINYLYEIIVIIFSIERYLCQKMKYDYLVLYLLTFIVDNGVCKYCVATWLLFKYFISIEEKVI